MGAAGDQHTITVAIVTPLESELVEQIRGSGEHIEVLYEPDLLPPTRYPGDHGGVTGFTRGAGGERQWRHTLERAEVFFGLPGDSGAGLAAAVRSNPDLRWVQATVAGAGQQLHAAALTPEELERVTVTTASGVHAGPMAEFCILGLLYFARGVPRLQADQRAHRWDQYPVAELSGDTLVILGLGAIGAEVARMAKAFGMRTIGINRRGQSDSPDVDAVHSSDSLLGLLPQADAVVVTLPLTDETRGMLGAEALRSMAPGAVLVNVGRGAVIDEQALFDALREGRLSGAALDVFATEPLPVESPLWDLPNVLISPHTAALSVRENGRIVDLFIENLRRYRRGEPLLNRVDPRLFY
jgi:phosphoglycerate dehydrogenase-like enzyme